MKAVPRKSQGEVGEINRRPRVTRIDVSRLGLNETTFSIFVRAGSNSLCLSQTHHVDTVLQDGANSPLVKEGRGPTRAESPKTTAFVKILADAHPSLAGRM